LSRAGTKKGQAELQRKRATAEQRPKERVEEVPWDPVFIPEQPTWDQRREEWAGNEFVGHWESTEHYDAWFDSLSPAGQDRHLRECQLEADSDDAVELFAEDDADGYYRYLLERGYAPDEIEWHPDDIEYVRALQTEVRQ
jgi:hypothetical protein